MPRPPVYLRFEAFRKSLSSSSLHHCDPSKGFTLAKSKRLFDGLAARHARSGCIIVSRSNFGNAFPGITLHFRLPDPHKRSPFLLYALIPPVFFMLRHPLREGSFSMLQSPSRHCFLLIRRQGTRRGPFPAPLPNSFFSSGAVKSVGAGAANRIQVPFLGSTPSCPHTPSGIQYSCACS